MVSGSMAHEGQPMPMTDQQTSPQPCYAHKSGERRCLHQSDCSISTQHTSTSFVHRKHDDCDEKQQPWPAGLRKMGWSCRRRDLTALTIAVLISTVCAKAPCEPHHYFTLPAPIFWLRLNCVSANGMSNLCECMT